MSNVKVMRSSDYGAPVLYGSVSSSYNLVNLLDVCLNQGYGQMSVSSITHNNGVVTVTTAVAHNLKYGARHTIAGVNESGYNGDWLITPTGTYTFTYEAAGITVNTGTGTITSKNTGCGWSKPYTGTNLGAIRQGGGNQRYLRIDDSSTLYARLVGYGAMTDINSGTEPFPTASQIASGLYMQRSSTADLTNAREWILIADDRSFYLWVGYNSTYPYTDAPMMGFFDYPSTRSGDAYNTALLAPNSNAATGFRFSFLNTYVQLVSTGGMYGLRSYTQIGTSVELSRISDYSKGYTQANMGATGLVFPHPPDGALYQSPVWIVEPASTVANSIIRGVMPGIWNPLHLRPLAHADVYFGTGSLAGKMFLALNIQPTAQVMVEIGGTWSYS